jgi:hypothetical protein
MGRAVVNATQGDEVVRIIVTAFRTSHQMVNTNLELWQLGTEQRR